MSIKLIRVYEGIKDNILEVGKLLDLSSIVTVNGDRVININNRKVAVSTVKFNDGSVYTVNAIDLNKYIN